MTHKNAILVLLITASSFGCAFAPPAPPPNPCANLNEDQCHLYYQSKADQAAAMAGVSMDQIARNDQAGNRRWCETKAFRIADHDAQVKAIKECHELWPLPADQAIQVTR